MDKKLVEKAIKMQRDYSMDEIAELLGVRREELTEAVENHVKGDKASAERPTAPPAQPEPKPRGRKKKTA